MKQPKDFDTEFIYLLFCFFFITTFIDHHITTLSHFHIIIFYCQLIIS
jgi:hypothetical protein